MDQFVSHLSPDIKGSFIAVIFLNPYLHHKPGVDTENPDLPINMLFPYLVVYCLYFFLCILLPLILSNSPLSLWFLFFFFPRL